MRSDPGTGHCVLATVGVVLALLANWRPAAAQNPEDQLLGIASAASAFAEQDFSFASEHIDGSLRAQYGNSGDEDSWPNIKEPGPDLGDFPNSAFTLPKGRMYFESGTFSLLTKD